MKKDVIKKAPYRICSIDTPDFSCYPSGPLAEIPHILLPIAEYPWRCKMCATLSASVTRHTMSRFVLGMYASGDYLQLLACGALLGVDSEYAGRVRDRIPCGLRAASCKKLLALIWISLPLLGRQQTRWCTEKQRLVSGIALHFVVCSVIRLRDFAVPRQGEGFNLGKASKILPWHEVACMQVVVIQSTCLLSFPERSSASWTGSSTTEPLQTRQLKRQTIIKFFQNAIIG